MHRVIPVFETSQVGQVRRAIQELAARLYAKEDVSARAALVATELTTNLLKHSVNGGEILYRAVQAENGEEAGIEILSIDSGRGIPNISRAFNDGFSTAGSPGTGLGAIQRMSDSLEIFSADKKGTVLTTQILPRGSSSRKAAAPRIRSICMPLESFDVSGDYCVVQRKGTFVNIMVSDGLGHGEEAALASQCAAEVFRKNSCADLSAMMLLIHEALSKTRGAAVALASFDTERRILKYVAVGNIDARICAEGPCQGCATLNGTAGLRLPKLAQFEYEIAPGALIVMHSDGLSARWNLSDYPGLSLQSPGAVAGVLFRDFARKRDDATILVFAT
jgi:anti-sigma regulatory factor (Ser/Thr protein kinase)